MNLSDLVNGCFVREEDVFKIIEEDCILNRIPIMVFFTDISNVQFVCKLIRFVSGIKKDFNDLTAYELGFIDGITDKLYKSPLWVNDMIVKSKDDYKSAEETIINEKIKNVFVDILPVTISKSDIMKWSKEIGFNVYFTKFT